MRCDLYGKPFRCAVDAEHKATELQICSFALPHMRCFHASWMGFFATFFSTFAPAPLAAYLKREDTLALYCQSARAKSMRESRCVVVWVLKWRRIMFPWIESPHRDIRWRFANLCGALALRTAMDIGNGNIASVRLAFIFARIGTPGSKNM